MNRHVLGPLFAVTGVSVLMAFACAPQSVTDDDFGSGGTGSGSGGATSGIPYCGPATQCPVDASGVDLVTPVSFKTDIYPIFLTSCAIAACHVGGTPSASNWLGPEENERTGDPATEDANRTRIIEGLLEPSSIAPEMANVVPGNWQDSFLMLKLDGCQNTRGLTCTVQAGDKRPGCVDVACGVGMPNVNKPEENKIFPLPDDQRNKIRAWIAQGAQNN